MTTTTQDIYTEYKIFADDTRSIAKHLGLQEPFSPSGVTAIVSFAQQAKAAGLTVKKAIAAAGPPNTPPSGAHSEHVPPNPQAGQDFQGALATSVGGLVQSATSLYSSFDLALSNQEQAISSAFVDRVGESPLRTMQMIADGLDQQSSSGSVNFFPIAPTGAGLPVFAAAASPIQFVSNSSFILSASSSFPSSTTMEVEVQIDDQTTSE